MAEVSIRIKAEAAQAQTAINRFAKNSASAFKKVEAGGTSAFDQLKAAGMRWLAATASITGALYTIKKAMDLSVEGAKFKQAERAFDNLALAHGVAAGSMIEDLRKMSAETVSTADIIKSAGNAMTLGIPAERLSEMMAIARASSRITGQSVQKSFEDIAMGVGRQSKMILDNLGIIVDLDEAYRDFAESAKKSVSQLTDVEKKQAFVNAAMKKGGQIVRDIGIDGLTAAEKIDRFKAKLADTAVVLGEKLLPLLEKGIDFTARFLGGPPRTNDAISRLGEMRYKLEDLYKIQALLAKQVETEKAKPYGPLAFFGGRDEVFLYKAQENLKKITADIAKTESAVERLQDALIKALTPKADPTALTAGESLLFEQINMAKQAFEVLNLQSSGQLVEMADKAVAAFVKIKESGTATPGDIYRAYLAASEGIKEILDGLKGGAEVKAPEGGLKFAEDLEAASAKGYAALKEFQDKRAAEWDAYWNSRKFSTGPVADISAVEERLKSLKSAFEGVKTGQTFSPVVKVEGIEDAIGKVKSLDAQLKALTAAPTVIDIKGRGSAVLPISRKIDDIKTMFGSLEDLSPQVTADFSAVTAGIQSARESIAAQFAAFSQNQLVQSEVSRQASLGQNSFDATMKLFEKFQAGPQTNLGGVVINIKGGNGPAETARLVRMEIQKLNSRL